MTGKHEIDVNDSDFHKQVIEASKKTPVVVDFWAVWCGPCRLLGPILENLSEEYNGKFILAKLNVDENPKNSQKYEISSIPSVKMFKDGEVVAEFLGAQPESQVRKWIGSNL
ncbi:MAG TPA: thioredoxin [Candidatus Nanoarchaeia archaeon]|nr:thioredoxin [Candidatus Nanoarchaeia archaeon]